MKKLLEMLNVVASEPNSDIVMDNLTAEWAGLPYSQLSVILVLLRHLSMIHQTNHWVSKGDPFYGDHLLFERLYGTVSGEIYQVEEKAVGLGGVQNVDLQRQIAQLAKLMQSYSGVSTIPQPSDLAQRSLSAELNFIKCVTALMATMQESGFLTKGLDNLLAGILDSHENLVYLLKQRCSA
jgi:DNA-binding ferritin-like protein